MLVSNWSYMIPTFVLNLITATVLIFVICKLTYCIEFTKFVYFFLSLTSGYFVFVISEECYCLVVYVIAVAPAIV